jgi:hypothetical protein
MKTAIFGSPFCCVPVGFAQKLLKEVLRKAQDLAFQSHYVKQPDVALWIFVLE